ncbi:trace amine-associated receptor 6-like [Antedon mediterranea]|uniref:trace amine-associated receptor 6-like n=1 Tax=Antedon mediterranea TaxID=105859 RepID=UPI003AF98332
MTGSNNATTDEMRDNLIFVLSVYTPLALLIIAGNALVLFLIRQTKSYDKPQFVLLRSLAFVDLLTGIIAVPMHMWSAILQKSLFVRINCHLQYIPSVIFVSVSFFHLLLITVDRYVSIVSPLQHRQFMQLRKIYFAIAISWIICCFYGTMVLVFGNLKKIEGISFCYQVDQRALAGQRYTISCVVSIGTILMIVMYSRIVFVARKYEKMRVGTVSTRNLIRKRYKAAKTSALIIVAFAIAFLPYALKPVVYLVPEYGESRLHWYDLIEDALLYMNSAVNPFIYVWRVQLFSCALRRLLNNCFTRA